MSSPIRFYTHHPLDAIPAGWRPRLFRALLGLTILWMIVFGLTGAPLTTEAAPYGVVSFELAGTVERTWQILDSWDVETQLRAAFGLGLDFVFIITYASTIAFGCGLASQVLKDRNWPLNSWGSLLSWAVILAALLDIVENIALLTIIFGSVTSPWPEIARWCAIPKFILVFIGVVYVIYGGVVLLVDRISPEIQE